MKITSQNGAAIQSVGPTSSAQSARERAISKLVGATTATSSAPAPNPIAHAVAQLSQGAQQPIPVANANNISAEELGALKTSETSSESNQLQNNTTRETSSVETPSEAPKAETPKEDSLSSQYAQLAKREKALRVKAQALKVEQDRLQAELKAKEESFRTKETEYQSKFIAKDKLTSDPLRVLTEAGLSYEQITELMLNQANNPQNLQQQVAFEKLQAEIQAMRAEQEAAKKSLVDQQQESYKQVISQIRHDVTSLVKTDESFETIRATNSVDDVVELIERTFHEGLGEEYPKGTILDPSKAAAMVEDYLVDEALKIARLSKIQQKLKPTASTSAKSAPKATESKSPEQPQTLKTLTNSVGASRQLSARERAIAAFQGKLK